MESSSVAQSFTYGQGQAECEKIGTGLAIIRNQSDYNALMSTVLKSGILLDKRQNNNEIDDKIWISGRKSSGSWKWYTGEVIPTPWFWLPGEPNYGGCARLRTVTSPFEVKDHDCVEPVSFFYKLACE